MFAFDDVTRGCLRDDETAEIILVPGLLCEPETARALLPTVTVALLTLRQQLLDKGFVVEDSP